MHWGLAAILGAIVVLGVTAVLCSALAGEDSCVDLAGVGWSSGLLQGVVRFRGVRVPLGLTKMVTVSSLGVSISRAFTIYDLSSSFDVIMPFLHSLLPSWNGLIRTTSPTLSVCRSQACWFWHLNCWNCRLFSCWISRSLCRALGWMTVLVVGRSVLVLISIRQWAGLDSFPCVGVLR